jgi:hypothetical protein
MCTLSTLSIVQTLWVTLLLGTSCAPLYESPCLSDPSCPSATIDRAELPLTATLSVPIALQLGSPALLHQLELMNDRLSVHLDQGEVSLVLPHTVKEPGLAVTVPARLEDKLFHAGPAELRIQIGNERILLPTKLTAPKFKQSSFTKPTNGQIAWVGIPDRTINEGTILTKINNDNTLHFKSISPIGGINNQAICNKIITSGGALGQILYHQMTINRQCYYSEPTATSNVAAVKKSDTQFSPGSSFFSRENFVYPFTEPNLNLMLIFNPTSDNKSAASTSVIDLIDSMNSKSNPIPIKLNTGSRNAFAIVTLDASNTATPYVMIWDANGVRFAFKNPTIENPLTFDIVTNNSLIASLTDRVKQVLTLCSTGNVRFVSGKVTPPVNKHWNDLVVACSSGIYVIERADADSFQVPVQAHLIDAADKLISTLLPAFNRIDIGVLGGTAGEDIVLIQDDVGTRQSDRIDFYVGVE